MNRRAVAGVLAVLVFFAAGISDAQEIDSDAIKRCYGSRTGFRACVGACATNLQNARDACDTIDWTGWGGYCEIRANQEYQTCVAACYFDYCS